MSSGRQLLRELLPRQSIERESALGLRDQPYPSIFEDINFITFIKGLDIRHNTPELRFTELDQADPVGRFRWRGVSGGYILERALTANWATSATVLYYDLSNTNINLTTPNVSAGDNAWYVQLNAGGTRPSTINVGGSTSAAAGVELRTSDGTASTVIRLGITTNIATADIDITNALLDMNSSNIKKVFRVGGDGTNALQLQANYAATDATARRITMDVLDPATDTVYVVAQAVPKAATPLFTMTAPNYTPTTSELDATNVTFKYVSAGAITMYVNDAGVIKSLTLGTPA